MASQKNAPTRGAYNNPYYIWWPKNTYLNVGVFFYKRTSENANRPGVSEEQFSMFIPNVGGLFSNNYYPQMPTAWNPNPVPYDVMLELNGSSKHQPPSTNLPFWDLPALVTQTGPGQMTVVYYDIGNNEVPDLNATPVPQPAIEVDIRWHNLTGKKGMQYLTPGKKIVGTSERPKDWPSRLA